VTEPELALGDSGEWVLDLQTCLQALGRYEGALDGRYGEKTDASVTQLQADAGVSAAGKVDALTWAALREAQGGAQTFRREPSKAFDGHLPVGALSEDQQWRWDGDGWQPKEERVAALAAQDEPPGHVSADGQWLWDGDKWRAVDNMSRRGENA